MMADVSSISEDQEVKCLNALDIIRAEGVGHDMDLPQMVVVGEQSSGKSSVVESITGAPLPKDEGLCTKFPTVLAMRYATTSKVDVSIIPAAGRSHDERLRLRRFSRTVSTLDSIGPVISEATRAIEAGDAPDRTFRRDSLLIHFAGPRCLNLTVVDLPGLFQTSGEGQTEEDADFVNSMISDYINRPRTVVVVVVAAQNVLVNQVALRVVKKADPAGVKTIGVITKPDLLRSEVEPQKFNTYMTLLHNKEHKLKHGWHVLKNRGPNELHLDMAGRDKAEEEFFDGPDWQAVPQHLKGIQQLGRRLCSLQWAVLQDCIPSLVAEAEGKLSHYRVQLEGAGHDVKDQKNQLLAISYGVNKELGHAFTRRHATGSDASLALRGNVTALLSECSKTLSDSHAAILGLGAAVRSPTEELVQHVLGEMGRRNTVPGQIDSVLVADLFRDQSRDWPALITGCIGQVVAFTEQCLAAVLEGVTPEVHPDVASGITEVITTPAVHTIQRHLRNKFSSVLDGRVAGTEIDLNLEVYEQVQQARANHVRDLVAAQFGDEQQPRYRDQFLDGIQRAALDIDRFTAVETIACVEAHLKVSRCSDPSDVQGQHTDTRRRRRRSCCSTSKPTLCFRSFASNLRPCSPPKPSTKPWMRSR